MTEIATQTVESDDPLLGVAESVSELDESQLLLLKQKVLAFTGQCVNSARSSIRLVYYSLALILCVAALATVYFNFQGHHYRTTLILLVLGPAMLLLLGYWKLLKMLTSLPDQVNDVVRHRGRKPDLDGGVLWRPSRDWEQLLQPCAGALP